MTPPVQKRTVARRIKTKLPEEIVVVIRPPADADIVHRYSERVRNPKTAIRAFCVACVGGYLKDVAQCTAFKCALHPFRMGVNPFNKTVQERLAREAGETDTEDDDDTNGETE